LLVSFVFFKQTLRFYKVKNNIMISNLNRDEALHRVFLCIGGNLGDKELYLKKTVKLIEEKVGRILQKSSVFESESWGFAHSSSFLNQVVEVETMLSALCLLDVCHKIEEELGRDRYSVADGYAARTADVDILFFDDCIYSLPPLILPHEKLHERLFVLEPLAEIAPNLMHSKIGKTVLELKNACLDNGRVWKYKRLKVKSES